MKTITYLTIPFIIILFSSCTKKETAKTDCGETIIINDNKYSEVIKDKIEINNAFIESNCLTISISASGCDGHSWDVNLYAQSTVSESYPTKRNIAISLDNKEECEAYIKKDFTFDLSEIPNKPVELLLYNYTESLLLSN